MIKPIIIYLEYMKYLIFLQKFFLNEDLAAFHFCPWKNLQKLGSYCKAFFKEVAVVKRICQQMALNSCILEDESKAY